MFSNQPTAATENTRKKIIADQEAARKNRRVRWLCKVAIRLAFVIIAATLVYQAV